MFASYVCISFKMADWDCLAVKLFCVSSVEIAVETRLNQF